ncbi:hypothetical protein [Novosphingobium lentum]|uniref:hypothetical protein n=1 Tax=Novosphingobium lentum TaxID=145287 RepID=UPI0012EE2DB4|nr:hypothetical protein [Novosphingobium lentum]
MPAFVPVPVRGRRDGWTPERQGAFLVALARTRSVRAAAQCVGMTRETAYRLRRHADAASFAGAWDIVLGRAAPGRRKVTPDELATRALVGLVRPVVHAGRFVALVKKADNSALLRLFAQLDRACRGTGARLPDRQR